MRIAELRTFVVGNPPPSFGGRYFVFLTLTTDDGVKGVGEVYAATFHPRALEAMIADVFERHVAGADPFAIETLVHRISARGYSGRPDLSLMGVLSGIEMACWDIIGQGGRTARRTSFSADGCTSGSAPTPISIPSPATRRTSTRTPISRPSVPPRMRRRDSPR